MSTHVETEDAIWSFDAADLLLYQLRDEKGQPSGYAALDIDGKVPLAQLPPLTGGSSGDSLRVVDLSVAPYFCDPTGVDDCTPAITQAIADASSTVSAVKTLYAPQGTYRIEHTSGFTHGLPWASGLRLIGDGMFGGTIFKMYGTNFRFISWASQEGVTSGSPTHDFEFRDFELDCSNITGNTTSTNKGFHMQYVRNARWLNVYVHDCGMSGFGIDHCFESVLFHGCYAKNNGRLNDGVTASGNGFGIGTHGINSDQEPVTISDCWATGNKRYNIFVEAQNAPSVSILSSGARIIGNYASGGQYGIGDCGNRRSIILGNTCTANSTAGIAVDGGTFTTPIPGYEGLISSNMVYSNTGHGILLDIRRTGSPPGKWNIQGNELAFNTGSGVVVSLDAIDFAALKLAGNNIHDNGKTGIRVSRSGAATAILKWSEIGQNMIFNNGTSSTASDKDGIRIDVPCTAVTIVGNRVFDWQTTKTQDYGLVLSQAFTGGSITGNDFRDNKTAGTNITGAISATTATLGNYGYTPPAPAAVTPGASPWTYTAGLTPERLSLYSGTVSSITVGGVQVAAATNVTLALESGDAVIVTYSSAPTVAVRR